MGFQFAECAHVLILAMSVLVPIGRADIPSGHEVLLVIDAGSSGSRLEIFHWEPVPAPVYKKYEPEDVDLKLRPGISTMTPAAAAASIKTLLDTAISLVPTEKHSDTRVYIGATAGMRLLAAGEQTVIWTAIIAEVHNSPFKLVSAATMSGEEEAGFGWLSVNWLHSLQASDSKDSKDGKTFKTPTVGSFDMGGASTQAAFAADVDILENKWPLTVQYNDSLDEFPLYANSWMRSGMDQAHLRLLRAECGTASSCNSVCHMKDFTFTEDLSNYGGDPNVQVVGIGNWSACYQLIKSSLLHLNWECLFNDDCAMAAQYFPELPAGANKHFYAYAAFFYSLNGIGAVGWSGQSSELSDYQTYGTTWCNGQGSKNGTELTRDPGYAKTYCFCSAYAYGILVDGYGFSPSPGDQGQQSANVIVTRKIAGQSVSWAFGAMLFLAQDTHADYEIGTDLQCPDIDHTKLDLVTKTSNNPSKTSKIGVLLDGWVGRLRQTYCGSDMNWLCQAYSEVASASPSEYAGPIDVNDHVILVLDAGSTGTRLQIYYFEKVAAPIYKQYEPEDTVLKLKPGISSMTSKEAAASIKTLLDTARLNIPTDMQTPIYVHIGATAGMRLLKVADQTAIWTAIKAEVEASPFKLGTAGTLSGEEESVFGWLAVNWLHSIDGEGKGKKKGMFSDRGGKLFKAPTAGSFDLGGASTQATFVPDVNVLENKWPLVLHYNESHMDYPLYANSWMRSGQTHAHLRLLRAECGTTATSCRSVCHVKGFAFTEDLSSYGGETAVQVVGTGNWSACYAMIKKELIHLDWECLFGSDCAMAGQYFPELPANKQFYAYAAFFYSLNGIGAVGWSDQSSDLSGYKTYGTTWCNGQGSKNGAELTKDPGYAKFYCFTSAYSYAIFIDAYGFSDAGREVIVTRKIGGVSASWAFGALLYYAQDTHLYGIEHCQDSPPPLVAQEEVEEEF